MTSSNVATRVAARTKVKKVKLTQAQGMQKGGVTRLLRPNGTAIETRWESIGPDLAKEYLQKNGRNRRLIESLSSRYGADQAHDRWVPTHQGIAFNLDDELVDGQHRLDGVVKSGKSVWFLVTRGLDRDAIEALDRGKMRSLAHAMQIMGYSVSSNKHVAVGRAMMYGTLGRPSGKAEMAEVITDIMTREFMAEHAEAILFACGIASSYPAQVTAVIARAYYHAAPAELERFVQAMKDAVPKEEARDGDRTARALAKMIDTARGGRGGTSGWRTGMYRKAQNALSAYLSHKDFEKIYENSDDLFPLPGGDEEGKRRAAAS
jgi:hypothetical protein